MSIRPFRLGVLDLVPQPEGITAESALAEASLLARLAEQWGYERYWAAEHHDLPGLACAAPEVLLSHIGAVTSRIRLGTGALLLPHYSPLKVAETFHLLSALYPGRIDLGIGRAPGGPAHASMALSGNFLQRVYGMEESVRSLIQLLGGDYRYDGQPVSARPVPQARPELWLLGTGRKSAAYAAANGCGYVFGGFMSDEDGEAVLSAYREQFVPSECLKEPRTIVAVNLICAETSAKAVQLTEESRGFRPDEEGASRSRHSIAGSPAEVFSALTKLQKQYQTEEFLIGTPISDYEQRRESYRLLAAYMTELKH
ncbi:MsnO8 family LLM class oxidoreductase [Paenibacillus caui]|uniref:MsnO8 family LLM class oxidoreductase n=1 Tax=Paenibacillus caui TaxID=2873927 RepID=UPI001CA85E1D|nr:MsnO8 family LLM class oxidoreductase [Paenibacillus caui]